MSALSRIIAPYEAMAYCKDGRLYYSTRRHPSRKYVIWTFQHKGELIGAHIHCLKGPRFWIMHDYLSRVYNRYNKMVKG